MEKNLHNEPMLNVPDPVDLTSLKDLTFRPSWANAIEKQKPSSSAHSSHKSQPRRPYRPNQQASSPALKPEVNTKELDQLRQLLEVSFYPEETAFKALCRAMRAACKTYELFQLAHLLLEKPERFIVGLRLKANVTVPQMFVSVLDQVPFEAEAEALQYVFNKHFEHFFEVRTIEQEAPKGEFQQINRCGITQELIGPSNYHKYPQLLQEHYSTYIYPSNYDRFINCLETIRDPEAIATWLQKMTQTRQYSFKNSPPDQPIVFETLEAARKYLQTNHLSKLIKPSRATRFSGKLLDKVDAPNFRKLIKAELEYQKRFPLVTANGIRGRLRRMGLFIYKKGSKGISYICAVKRKYRTPDTVFAEPIQKLIAFIESHPSIFILDLPFKYLNLSVQEKADAQGLADLLAKNEDCQEVMRNIRWLVAEGYITEYENGLLQVSPRVKRSCY